MSIKEVIKPWGKEVWTVRTDRYVVKHIFIKAGYRTSLQYHTTKDETMFFIKGKFKLYMKPNWFTYSIRKSGMFAMNIWPTLEHRVQAITDTELIEMSTPEVEDVVRLEDDYGRQTK